MLRISILINSAPCADVSIWIMPIYSSYCGCYRLLGREGAPQTAGWSCQSPERGRCNRKEGMYQQLNQITVQKNEMLWPIPHRVISSHIICCHGPTSDPKHGIERTQYLPLIPLIAGRCLALLIQWEQSSLCVWVQGRRTLRVMRRRRPSLLRIPWGPLRLCTGYRLCRPYRPLQKERGEGEGGRKEYCVRWVCSGGLTENTQIEIWDVRSS
jgi:hypothetical protein